MKKLFYFSAAFLTLSVLLSHSVMAEQTKENKTGKPIAQNIALIGADSLGKKLDLKAFAGKTILVSFYTAGCSVCARDLKLMREFYRDNAAKNFVLIGINTDKKRSDFDNYSAILELNTPKNQKFPLIWRDGLEKLDGFGKIKTDPTHFVINSKGEIVLRREGTFKAEDWDNLWEWLSN